MLQDNRFCHQHNFMKPISSLVNGGTKQEPRYSVHFDDGITLIVHMSGDDIVYENMLSVGLNSYYLQTGKWPKGKQLEKRLTLAKEYIHKNKKRNRYRKKLDDE